MRLTWADDDKHYITATSQQPSYYKTFPSKTSRIQEKYQNCVLLGTQRGEGIWVLLCSQRGGGGGTRNIFSKS